jgi:CysZ protein
MIEKGCFGDYVMFPFMKTLRSIFSARLLGLMLLSAVLGIIVVVLGVVAITWISANMIEIEIKWMDTLVSGIISIITSISGWFLLPAVVVLIAGMFQEIAISRVEAESYPHFQRQERPKFWPDALHDIKFVLWALFLNILVLPFHLIVIGFLISIALNSYLTGREFFEMAAGYHIGKPQAHKLIRYNRRAVYIGGFVITLMAVVPLLNLFVPIVAVVWMVHVYHHIDANRGSIKAGEAA